MGIAVMQGPVGHQYQRFVQLWGTRETRMWRNRSPNPHMLVCSCHNCVGVKTVIS